MTTPRPVAAARPGHRPRFEGRVDEDAVYAFARATNDGNERYERAEAVPPLFTAMLILPAMWNAQREGMGENVVTGASGGAHGEHDIYYWGALRPGMALEWDAATLSARQTKAGVLITQRIVVSDTAGSPLVEHLWSSIYIGGTIAADVGPPLPDHAFPPEARARPVATRAMVADRDQAFRFAGVSGDHNGHALTDDIARREGHPGKILQGMCTFGMVSGQIVDAVADGDPDRLRRLAVRFSAPSQPGKELTVGLYDAGCTDEGGRAFAFEVLQAGKAVLTHGRAELLPDLSRPPGRRPAGPGDVEAGGAKH